MLRRQREKGQVVVIKSGDEHEVYILFMRVFSVMSAMRFLDAFARR